MAKMTKLHKLFPYGSDEYKALVHAYYHLMHHERGERMVFLAGVANAPDDITQYWAQYAAVHYYQYAMQLAFIPEWEDYLDRRNEQNAELRVHIMMKTRPESEEAPRRKRAIQKKREFERMQKSRHN